jgi:hypothetical protein
MCEKAELEPIFSVDEISDSIGMSPRSVRRWVDEEELVAHQFVGVCASPRATGALKEEEVNEPGSPGLNGHMHNSTYTDEPSTVRAPGFQFGESTKPTLTPPPAVPRSGWHSGASLESSIRTITHRQKRCRNKAKSFPRLRTASGILRSRNGWSFAS